MSSKWLRIAGTAAAMIAVTALPGTAWAGPNTAHITGDCGTSLVVGSTVRTSSGQSSGRMDLRYTNGMGSLVSNYVKLRISPIRRSTGNPLDSSTPTVLVGASTGGTYDLVPTYYLGGGIEFTFNFRADSTPGVDSHWEGDLTY
jgi:hypothetical protein